MQLFLKKISKETIINYSNYHQPEREFEFDWKTSAKYMVSVV
jgi:hypothetical protein